MQNLSGKHNTTADAVYICDSDSYQMLSLFSLVLSEISISKALIYAPFAILIG